MNSRPQQSENVEAMSQVEIACPQCRAAYRVAAHLSGRRFQCQRCKHVWRWGTKSDSTASGRSDSGVSRQQDSTGLPVAGATSSLVIDTRWAGQRLGRYQLTAPLGRGGMGVVWRAHDPTLKRDVAIKILTLPTNGASKSSLSSELFLQEARAAAKLNHPGAITVFEIAEDRGHQFIAMELMHEGTLKDRVDKFGPLEPKELFRLMIPPARALALAHERGIVHRDVKPGNLMFDDQGLLKLGDFGLSDVAGDPTSARLRGRSVGSLGWIAPETARGEPTTAASDIYAFGLVLYYALTARQWLYAERRSDLLSLHQNPPEPELHDIPGLSSDGMALLRRALAKDPADRFQSADELATFLEHCASEPDEAHIPRVVAERSQRRIVFGSMVGAIAVIAGVLGIIWVYLGRDLQELRSATDRLLSTPARTIRPHGTKPAAAEPSPASVRPWPEIIDARSLHFIASSDGTTYHTPACDDARRIPLVKLVNYASRADAEAAGKTPCATCRPDRLPAEHAEKPSPPDPARRD